MFPFKMNALRNLCDRVVKVIVQRVIANKRLEFVRNVNKSSYDAQIHTATRKESIANRTKFEQTQETVYRTKANWESNRKRLRNSMASLPTYIYILIALLLSSFQDR